MRRLDAAAVLDVWERAWPLAPIDRALTLWAAASGRTDAATQPIGERERALLRMRRAMFGSAMDAVAECPGCGEPVEIATDVDSIVDQSVHTGEARVEAEGLSITCRAPTSEDIALAALGGDVRAGLARRCVVEARRYGVVVDAESLPASALDAIESALADVDPSADIRFDLCCPACDHWWEARFDAGAFLWAELDAHARRLAADVHVLASAYGWSETDILGLSPTRRRLYVEVAAR